jgi:prepilin-type N-terminal cleavage/methylation domain-containing protein
MRFSRGSVVRRRPSYTLLELVLVIALLGILTAISYPSLDSMYGHYQVAAAADMVRARWAEARARALDEGQAYRFAVIPNQGNFRVAPDGADYWSGSNNPSPNSDSPPLILEENLPKGVRFVTTTDAQSGDNSLPNIDTPPDSGSGDSSKWTKVVTFLPDGRASDNVQIVFQTRGARPLQMKLRGLTGVVTVQPMDSNDNRR